MVLIVAYPYVVYHFVIVVHSMFGYKEKKNIFSKLQFIKIFIRPKFILVNKMAVYFDSSSFCVCLTQTVFFQFHEERQMAWDQREVELERQLDIFDRQQNEILKEAQKV